MKDCHTLEEYYDTEINFHDIFLKFNEKWDCLPIEINLIFEYMGFYDFMFQLKIQYPKRMTPSIIMDDFK